MTDEPPDKESRNAVPPRRPPRRPGRPARALERSSQRPESPEPAFDPGQLDMSGPTSPPKRAPRTTGPARDHPASVPAFPTLYVIGEVEETGDLVIAATDEPENSTEVWIASAPDVRTSLADLDDELGEGAIHWATEPDPYLGSEGQR
jgi:hypothetical protein